MARRIEILQVARDLFLESGLEALTLRAVAARVKISATAIYRHFESKDDLLRQVVDMGRERFASCLVQGLRGTTPRERLLATGENYLEFAFANPQDYRIMFLSWHRLQVGLHAPAQDDHSPTFQFLLDRVRECLPPERAANARAVFEDGLLLWAECHGLASLYLSGGAQAVMPLEEYRSFCKRQLERMVDFIGQ